MSRFPLRADDPEHLGGYELVGRLGSGGMGTVFLGRSPQGRPVAIKMVRAEFTHDPEFLGRFRSEVNRARQVPPFCTAEVLDADLDHDPPYLVVEYVDGPNLSDVVRERGPLSAGALHSAALGIATALAAIHGAGVIHRDLKPGNVLFALGGLKVIDFGIARPLEATSQHTRTDQIVGTLAYMAPERFDEQPGLRTSTASDIFAWGAVVTYAGTGRTPFVADSAPAMAVRILTQPPTLTGLPAPLRDIVARTLAKDPDERPTARELLDLLLAVDPSSGAAPTRPAAPVAATRPAPAQPATVAPDQPVRAGGEGPGRQQQPAAEVADQVPQRRAVGRAAVAVVALGALLLAGFLGYNLLSGSGSDPDASRESPSPAGPTGTSTGSPRPSSTGAPGPSAGSPTGPSGPAGNDAILAGTRQTLIHFAEKDRDLALPLPDEVVPSDGTSVESLFALVPVGVDYMIKSMQPNNGEPRCLGVKINPTDWATLVGTECRPSKATLFSITSTGRRDDKGRPTYTIFNEEEGLVQWSESKSEIYVQFPGDADPNATFSFVDRGPLDGKPLDR
ncbi:protein kinase [Micromonospora sp. WMMD1102]|uniref:serine/threonine protein kinase n=1 Tax=Micromonospora sp. WMMD1102 TaxID=3016105 RepID=UPI0024158240|nr:serine/threonine-protein kinase [Micromonospora sp. WMMD1102]MDG4785203.1 protein kinase [Micromonospora sp. WMMD1102]